MTLRINKPYIATVLLIGSAAMLFIGYLITSQFYQQWAYGLPVTGGWSWSAVLAVDGFCLLCLCVLYWKIYADANTFIDASGVTRPSLRGRLTLTWAEVTDIKLVNGAGIHLYGAHCKIVISPYAYHHPHTVIKTIEQYLAPPAAP